MFYESVLRFGFYITTSAFIFRDFSSMIILNHRYDDPRDEGQLLYEYKVSSTTWIFSSKTHIFSEALNLWPSSSYTYNQNPCPSRSQFECRMTMTSRDDPNPREDKRLLPSNVQKRKNPFMNGNHIPQTHNQNQPNGGDSCKRSVTGDIQYLRKRTEHILRITTPPPPSHTLSSSSTNTDLESSSVSHNPGDIPDSTITTSAVPSNLVFMSTVPLISSKGMKADRKTFNWLIDAWSTSGEIDAPEKATALLERMEELTWPHVYNTSSSSSIMSASLTPSSIFQPNIQSYTKVMSAYARSGRPDAGILAEDLLNRMLAAQVDRYSSTYPYAYTSGIPFPTAQTFTHVMEAYANSGSIDAAPKVQQLCNQIEQMYLSFLRQEEVVEEEKNHRQRVFPNSQQQHPNYYLDKTHTNFLSLHHQQQIINPSLWEDTQHSLRPTARLYNALINAWAKSELDGAAQMAERCLDRMEEMQAMVGGEDLIPNTFHYNSVIHAWANRGGLDSTTLMDIDLEEDGIVEDTSSSTTTMDVENYKINLIPAERAEGILERIEASFRLGNLDARPNTISYNACIDAWAKSCHEKAGKRAETLLRRMEELYESKINLLVKPNTRSYNSVMNAYSKSRDPNSARNAERIFDEMESLYKAGNIDVKPDFISFATIIVCVMFLFFVVLTYVLESQ